MSDSKYFSKSDINNEYLKIEIDKKYSRLLAFVTMTV